MQIGIANGIPLNDVITGDDLVPAYDQSTGTEGYVNLTTAVQKAFSGSAAGTANGVLYLDGSKVATSGSALQFQNGNLLVGTSSDVGWRLNVEAAAANALRFLNTSGFGATILLADQGNSATISQNSGSVITSIGSSEQMRLTSTGLGIGTSSPNAKLQIVDPGNPTRGIIARFTNSATTGQNGAQLQITQSGIEDWAIGQPSGTSAFAFWAGRDKNSADGTEMMRLDSSGNLGLGVTPSAWGGSNKAIDIGSIGGVSADAATMRATNNVYSDSGGTFRYKTTAAALLYGQNPSIGHFWNIAPSGTAGDTISFTQAMTLNTDGNLFIGTTTYYDPSQSGRIYSTSSSKAASFETTSDLGNSAATFSRRSSDGDVIEFFRNTTFVGSIGITTTATSYNTSSDYRLKNITGPVTNSGAYIDSLNPVEGTWKADGSTFVGLIAHEVQEVSRTQVATGEKDGEQMQAMDYSNSELIANLIAEVQALRKRVAQLETR